MTDQEEKESDLPGVPIALGIFVAVTFSIGSLVYFIGSLIKELCK